MDAAPPPPMNGNGSGADPEERICPTCPEASPAVRRRLDEAHEALDQELEFLLGRTPADGTPTRALQNMLRTGTMRAFKLVELEKVNGNGGQE